MNKNSQQDNDDGNKRTTLRHLPSSGKCNKCFKRIRSNSLILHQCIITGSVVDQRNRTSRITTSRYEFEEEEEYNKF